MQQNENDIVLVFTDDVSELTGALRADVVMADYVYHTENNMRFFCGLLDAAVLPTRTPALVIATDSIGRVLGYAYGHRTREVFELYKLFVYRSYRKKGIGTTLLESLRTLPHVEEIFSHRHRDECGNGFLSKRCDEQTTKHPGWIHYEF